MKITRYSLWNFLITYVNTRIADINNILQYNIMCIGIFDDIKKDTLDAGLGDTCDKILTTLSELYDRVLEIKTQCAFIEEPKKEEVKNEK